MGLIDKLNQSGKSAAGNLKAFKIIRQSELVKNNSGGGNNLITNMWRARGPMPFRLPTDKSTSIIFLSDVTWIPVLDLAIGEKKGKSGKYPIIESFRSQAILGISEDGNFIQSGNKCLLELALGRAPKLVAVAKVLDTTPYTTKAGKVVKHSVKLLVIPGNSAVLQQLSAASEMSGKPIQYACFNVMRSSNEKTPKIGDSWTYSGHVEEQDVRAEDGVMAEAEAIDLEKGYPVLTNEDAVYVLKQHRRVCAKFTDTKNATLTYDEEEMGKICGDGKIAAPEAEAAPVEEPKSKLIGSLGLGKTIAAKRGGLDDLEDIPVGNPLDGPDIEDIGDDSEEE